MLYDKRWEADPLKLETLISWLELQPSDKLYCYSNMKDCLIAQYGAAHGRQWDNLTNVDLTFMGFFSIASNEPQTFGGALERARKLLIDPCLKP
jgi:hypothetical protein